MNLRCFTLVFLFWFVLQNYAFSEQYSMKELINHVIEVATKQSFRMCYILKDSTERLPRTIDRNGNLMTSDSRWWCSGFFPGVLWYIYEATGNIDIQKQAELYTERVVREKYTKSNHDVGFMIFCSFGNGYRLTHKESYRKVIETTYYFLLTRYSDKMKCICSWDYNKKWQYPVIIDNMMNLEMLLWGAKSFNNERFKEIAIDHANTTLKNHFRADYSCYHLISHDSITAKPHLKQTH